MIVAMSRSRARAVRKRVTPSQPCPNPPACSGALLSCTLLLVTGCAFEADLLTTRGEKGELDAGALGTPTSLAPGSPLPDGSVTYYEDATTWNQGYDTLLGENSRYDGSIPFWPVCDNKGAMFDQARTGDRCGFPGGCTRAGAAPCTHETAYCTLNSILVRSTVSKESCLPDDPMLASCALQTNDCCFWLGPCDSLDPLDPLIAGHFCTDGCKNLIPAVASAGYVLGCPNGRGDQPWPPVIGGACVGNFVCDSAGFSIGSTPAIPTFDTYGRIYFCEFDVMQAVVSGPLFPWNEGRPPSLP